MREHELGPFGRADLHPRRNPLDQQGRFAPQPGSIFVETRPAEKIQAPSGAASSGGRNISLLTEARNLIDFDCY
jgi:hypothetical protein